MISGFPMPSSSVLTVAGNEDDLYPGSSGAAALVADLLNLGGANTLTSPAGVVAAGASQLPGRNVVPHAWRSARKVSGGTAEG
jgi:hypothetical protein